MRVCNVSQALDECVGHLCNPNPFISNTSRTGITFLEAMFFALCYAEAARRR